MKAAASKPRTASPTAAIEIPEAAPLYDAIRKDPTDPAPYLVLADALIAHGDPRGELISVQNARSIADTPELAAAETKLLETHREQLLGKRLAAALDKVKDATELSVDWRLGMLRKLRLEIGGRSGDVMELVQALFESPASYVLESLDLQMNFSGQKTMNKLIDAIAPGGSTTLRELRLASSECNLRHMHTTWARLPNLRSVRIGQWGGIDLGAFEQLANLEDLELIGPSEEDVQKILKTPPARLRRLCIDVLPRVSLDLLAPLLCGAIPSLRDVGIYGNDNEVRFERMELGNVQSIALGPVRPETIATILQAGKHLRRLQLHFGRAVTRADIQPILDGALPELRELYLGKCDGFTCSDILDAKVLAQLEVLDIVDRDIDEMTKLATHRDRLAHLKQLRLITPPNVADADDDPENVGELAKLAQLREVVEVVAIENRVLKSWHDFNDRPCATCAPYRAPLHQKYDDLRERAPMYPGLEIVAASTPSTGRDQRLLRCTACSRNYRYRSTFEVEPNACDSEEWLDPISDAEAIALRKTLVAPKS